MNETFVVTVFGAALSGLTFVVYRHPDGYRRIFLVVLPVCLFLAILICSDNLGYGLAMITSLHDDLQRNPNDPLNAHSFAIQQLYEKRELIKTFLMYLMPAIGYLIFLRFLPDILGLRRQRI